ncbi:hypothetical protein PF010_g19544 [Phytophthora fragariae]|uniref:Uncharacterized protein n=1 Tax=Phytophthora fragariae TaxID=53985 RepID=A0A6A3J914_9STRA|nr:hypothetical protein PF011_g19009 [Phytophthora fragariae]KAE9087938.1 hypothetical protein PF010_g19544 [Phytophthora fragariae]
MYLRIGIPTTARLHNFSPSSVFDSRHSGQVNPSLLQLPSLPQSELLLIKTMFRSSDFFGWRPNSVTPMGQISQRL